MENFETEPFEGSANFYRDAKVSRSRGRPLGMDDGRLLGNRDFLVWLLESTWSEVGLALRRVKTTAAVRIALQPWEQNRDAHSVVDALLRPTEHPTTPKKLRALEQRKAELGHLVQDADARRQECQKSLEKVDNVLTLLEQDKKDERVSTLTQELTEDQKAIAAKERIKRMTALENAEAEYVKHQAKCMDSIEVLKDAYAYVAQIELVRFCNSSLYSINPLNVANALAGWPYLGHRQSIKRCRRSKPANAGNLPYIIVKILHRIISTRKQNAKLVQHAKQWLRTKRVSKSDALFNAVTGLRQNWYYLEHAISTVVDTRVLTRELPYKITTEYFRRLKARTSVDILFEEDERISS